MVLVVVVANGSAETEGPSGKKAEIGSTYERERANALENLKQSWNYNVELAKERSHYPHNPKVIETYLAAMQAEIDGDIEKCMTLLEESYQLSRSESGESLWNVLRCNYSDAAEHLFYLVDRLEGYSYEEKLVKYDHFSRYQPSDDRIQAYLLETMLERMSYDAVLEYCARRIAEGHEVYRVLRAELRLLMQQESIQHELIDQYKEEARRSLVPRQPGEKELTEARLFDEASQRYVRHYDPTTVVPKHVNIMLDELRSDPTRDVARLKRYCSLLRVSYEMTHGNKDAILSYFDYASDIINASDAEFDPLYTTQAIETNRSEALAQIRTCEAQIEKRSEDYARDRDAGKLGETYKYKPVVFDFHLDKRWEREEVLKKKGEEVSYLDLEDVLPH